LGFSYEDCRDYLRLLLDEYRADRFARPPHGERTKARIGAASRRRARDAARDHAGRFAPTRRPSARG
jgi:hypothetical protein